MAEPGLMAKWIIWVLVGLLALLVIFFMITTPTPDPQPTVAQAAGSQS